VQAAQSTAGGAPGALDGILVADFSRVLAGPYATMMLGDLGATVVKIESPEGDTTRVWGPPWRDGLSTYYQAINRNKQSIVLDLKQEEDLRLARELALRSDVVIENFLPGTMRTFGLDYESVAAENPGVVYCSISGFGSQPGAAHLRGFDLLVQAVGGLMSITGEVDGVPMKVGVALVDIICGLHACVGVVAALSARQRDGRGQCVEVNLLASTISALANQASSYLLGGVVPPRAGNAHPSVAPYDVFNASDGPVIVACGTQGMYVNLCRALGTTRLLEDPRFATNADRVAHRDELSRELDQVLSGWRRAELVAHLLDNGVAAGQVNDIAETFAYADEIGLDVTWDIDGKPFVRAPMTMSRTPPRPSAAPPELDASGEELRAWLAEPREDAGPVPAAPEPS
jgi:crotonobetainyl-CoA:carnitine CoA-transferase CaiB-like acyl-CoA transferase